MVGRALLIVAVSVWGVGCSGAVRQTRLSLLEPVFEAGRQALDEARLGTGGPIDGPRRGSPDDAWSSLATLEMSDEALGRLILELSEDTGDFPSDNFVSNETSYLHVASSLHDPELEGRAYVGVGPEQNLTYLTLMKSRVAYIVDIRRQNLLQHMVFRAMIEPSDTREAFLRRLTSRPLPEGGEPLVADAPIEEICDRLVKMRPVAAASEEGEAVTVALMERLRLSPREGDRQAIRQVIRAFARGGVALTYSMEGSRRGYPELRELLAARDDEGVQRGFLASEASYARLREMLRANRVVPVVGDFIGEKALRGVGADMRSRGASLGVFYTSNVEQYLWPRASYQRFVDNVKSLPADGSSRLLRVWFEQGKAHPRQRKGHRTTSLIVPLDAFLDRWDRRPYGSYWEVVVDSAR